MTDDSSFSLKAMLEEIRRDQKLDSRELMKMAGDMKLFKQEQAHILTRINEFSAKIQEVGELSAAHDAQETRILFLENDYEERKRASADIKKRLLDVLIVKALPYVCMAALAYLVHIQGKTPPTP